MLKFNQKYIDFDTETDGLNLKYSRPWELSYLVCDGYNIKTKRQIYIDVPNLDLPPFIKKLTGFSQEKYNDIKVSPEEAYEEFWPFLKSEQYLLVGQNILMYDVWMLKSLANMAKKQFDFSFMDRILDTRFMAIAEMNGLEKPSDGNYLNWFYKLGNDGNLKKRGSSQLALLKKLDISFEESRLHDGLYDVQKNWEIFLELKKRLKL